MNGFACMSHDFSSGDGARGEEEEDDVLCHLCFLFPFHFGVFGEGEPSQMIKPR